MSWHFLILLTRTARCRIYDQKRQCHRSVYKRVAIRSHFFVWLDSRVRKFRTPTSALQNPGRRFWAQNQTQTQGCNVWHTDNVLKDDLRENLNFLIKFAHLCTIVHKQNFNPKLNWAKVINRLQQNRVVLSSMYNQGVLSQSLPQKDDSNSKPIPGREGTSTPHPWWVT